MTFCALLSCFLFVILHYFQVSPLPTTTLTVCLANNILPLRYIMSPLSVSVFKKEKCAFLSSAHPCMLLAVSVRVCI